MPDIMSAVDIAAEFRDELARLDAAAVDVMVGQWRQVETALIADMEAAKQTLRRLKTRL